MYRTLLVAKGKRWLGVAAVLVGLLPGVALAQTELAYGKDAEVRNAAR